MGLVELQERIHARLCHGGSLRDVEREIIDPSPFSDEQKAALWLYASATAPKRTQGSSPRRAPSALLAWTPRR